MSWYIKKIAMSPQYIGEISEKKDLPFSNIFPSSNVLRTIIPLIDQDSLNIKNMLENGETKTGKTYVIDFENQIATTKSGTKQGEKEMKYRLGKVIQFELGQKWLDKWSRILKGEIKSDRSIIISRSPIDVLRMSDHEDISSCHSEGGLYFKSARMEAMSGGAVAYVVDNKDLEKININDDELHDRDTININDKEIFEDTCRGVKGIKPLSRIRINRYTSELLDGIDVAMPITREYPKKEKYIEKPVPGFLNSLTIWLRKKQKNLIDSMTSKLKSSKPKQIMDYFTRMGGDYADDSDGDIFNNFLGVEDFNGDVKHSGGASRLAIWTEEINLIVERENKTYEHCKIYADLEGNDYNEDDDYISIYGGADVEFNFKINREIEEDTIENFILSGTPNKWGKARDSIVYKIIEDMSLSHDDDPRISINQDGNNLKIEIGSYFGEVNEPDDLDSVASDIRDFERRSYKEYRYKIAFFLNSIGILKEELNPSSVIELAQDWHFNNIEIDDSAFSGKISFRLAPYIISNVVINYSGFTSERNIEYEINNLVKQKVTEIENQQKQQVFIKDQEYDEISNYEKFLYPQAIIYKDSSGKIMLSFSIIVDKNDRDELNNELLKRTLIFFDKNYDMIINSLMGQINTIIQKYSKKPIIDVIEQPKTSNNWYKHIKESAKSVPDWNTLEKIGPEDKKDYWTRDFSKEWGKRRKFTKEYGWSVPSEMAVKKIKQFIGGKKVLEVGSGFGLWAKLLQQHGVHMTPTDSFESHGTEDVVKDPHRSFTKVENIPGEQAVKKHSDSSVLFMSWPPYNCPLAADVLGNFKGDKLIYVGEGNGGCTGDDNFHAMLENNFILVEEVTIPQWVGLHDSVYLYTRKS